MNRQASTFRRVVLCVAVLTIGGSAAAWAEDTILRLAETATITVAPDELEGSIRAEALAPTAQEAQRRVNEMMRDAVATARKVDGVTVATGGYNVWRTGPTNADRAERWQAGQSLTLSGKDAEAILRLIGDLQQRGMVQSNLGWHLSPDAERKARQNATKQALAGLRGRADEAASILGLRFDSWREVRLDNVTPPPMPHPMGIQRATASAMAAPPPTVEAEDVPVTARAEADIVLKPR